MAEAVFLVDIDTDRAAIIDALTTQAGINGWWTTDASVTSEALDLGFPDAPARFDLRIDEIGDDTVRWLSRGSFPPHWVGTEITWQIMDNPSGSGSQVLFSHSGFAAPDPMFGHSSYTWALLMAHLKDYAETGVVKPFFA